jgi:dTDP-glucose 4,6-dehydratase
MNMPLRKLLITGGSGFIGTNFIHYIYEHYPDIEIFNLDSLDFPISQNNHKSLSSDRYRFILGSILDKELLNKTFADNKFDQVINFAAKSHVDTSIADPEIFTVNNVLGTQILLNVCLKHEIERFIQVSTDEVYGSLGYDSASSTEESCIVPNNPYSASKAGADCLVRAYHRTYKFPCLISRSSNNFGPYQYPEKLIPVIISNALHDKPIPVYGTGSNIRDWIYVEENCRAIDLIRRKGQVGAIYNIPGQKEINNLQLVKRILQLLQKSESLISFVEDRKGHDLRYSMDGSKLEKLGFKLSVNFDGNLLKTINWYLNNRHWLKVK